MNFTSYEDLEMRIERMFNSFDTDRGGSISKDELAEGLSKFVRLQNSPGQGLSSAMDDTHHIQRLSWDQWNVLTEDQRLCDEDGLLNFAQFRTVVFSKFRQHVQVKCG